LSHTLLLGFLFSISSTDFDSCCNLKKRSSSRRGVTCGKIDLKNKSADQTYY
jgi:hypothetical protein